MKRPIQPNRPDESAASPSADRRLKRAVREASAVPHAADVEALTARVLAQWRSGQVAAGQADVAAAVAAGGFRAASSGSAVTTTLGAQRRRRRLWAVGAAGLAAMAVVLATVLLVNRPDPDLQELMQPDVLSQLAIGEM